MGAREVLYPAGPLPASVYWWRRAAIALPVLLLLILLSSVTGGNGGRRPAAASAPPTSAAPSPASTQGAASGPASPATTTAPPTSATPTASTLGTCLPTVLSVSVTGTAQSYPPGQLIHLAATLTTASGACTAVGPLTIVVSSGNDRVWGSSDCSPATSTNTDLTNGGSRGVVETWDRTRTAPGCASVNGSHFALAGTYRAVATWAGVSSTPFVFTLT